ncbi:GDP-L-fucose synthase [Anaeromusa sp.]|uniref:GDP-L-fucose synthase n=1 Tax=Anaeromusa sp. TaxID=1872520 RepID=UPI0026347E4D|nr:GDP-L-fucose synthase [Anaeromusa sp.]MDD3157602.1 GDP-L-fucose synthase [Anaeromusa sp.]
MEKCAKIYVAGHRGLVGSAIVRELQRQGYENLVLRNSKELDLRCQQAVQEFFQQERPEYVVDAAAKVGGIGANSTYPAEFIYDNLMIQTNLIHAAHETQVKKLLFLGSSCIYPKMALQPLKEEYLLTGALEPTNEAYAIAKISGIKMCEFYAKQYGDCFISAMPTNLYGINDNFDLQNSHVLPALLRKLHEAKVNQAPQVVVWGTGTPRREFLFVDDLANACVFLLQNYDQPEFVNIGTGSDLTIAELALLMADIVGYRGELVFDASKPDGTPVKRLDVSALNSLGWQASTSLEEGIRKTYAWYLENAGNM